MTKSVDPGQTAPLKEQSDLGLHCLIGTSFPILKITATFESFRYKTIHCLLMYMHYFINPYVVSLKCI